jgi:hypothetical protein
LKELQKLIIVWEFIALKKLNNITMLQEKKIITKIKDLLSHVYYAKENILK